MLITKVVIAENKPFYENYEAARGYDLGRTDAKMELSSSLYFLAWSLLRSVNIENHGCSAVSGASEYISTGAMNIPPRVDYQQRGCFPARFTLSYTPPGSPRPLGRSR